MSENKRYYYKCKQTRLDKTRKNAIKNKCSEAYDNNTYMWNRQDFSEDKNKKRNKGINNIVYDSGDIVYDSGDDQEEYYSDRYEYDSDDSFDSSYLKWRSEIVMAKVMKAQEEILHRFKHTYYCLKYKQKFRDWLWVRVRLPKIMHNYSPDSLYKIIENCNTDNKLFDALDNWE